jgi:hypothetical protein
MRPERRGICFFFSCARRLLLLCQCKSVCVRQGERGAGAAGGGFMTYLMITGIWDLWEVISFHSFLCDDW